MADTPKQIFLSYAWANVNVADEIDNTFKGFGITFRRDVRDVAYTGSIKDFMKTIGDSDFVVMLISDEYVKSENCMYEVTELFNTPGFEARILPVIVNKAPVFKREGQKLYYDHWRNEAQKAADMHKEYDTEKTKEDKKKIQSIYDYLGPFFQKINDLKSIHFNDLKVENYKPMLERIGLKPTEEDILERLLEIDRIEDVEEKELAFENMERLYSPHRYVLFQRAEYARKKNQYKKAKQYYEELLLKYPDYSSAHYNLAQLFRQILNDYAQARNHYEQTIALNPQHSNARNNLAILLDRQFQEYDLAREHYEKAIEINPQSSSIHYNLAILLKDQFQEYQQAREHYKKAIEINPQDAECHNNLAILLDEAFKDYESAKKHFEKAIEIDPQYEAAKENLGYLIKKHFS